LLYRPEVVRWLMPPFILAAALAGGSVHARADEGGGGGSQFIDPTASIGEWVESTAPQENVWRGDAELGYLETGGNVNTRSFQTRGRVQYERGKWRHTGRLDIVITEDEGVTTTEQYKATQKSAFKLSAADYLFGLVRYTRNRFQNLNYQFAEVAGYGRRVVKNEAVELDVEAGAGARQTRTLAEEDHAEGIYVVASELDWTLNTRSRFAEAVYVESGRLNTLTTSSTSLTLLIEKDFSMKMSYEVTHNSDVEPGVKRTDTVSTVTLVYSF